MDKKKIMNWVIAIIIAIGYLTISIVFDTWTYSWIIWVIYAIYRFVAKQINRNLKGVTDMKFPFYDSPDTATIICCHILERQAPILYVSHDEDDGMWQFLCGETHETDEAKLVSLKWVFDLDNSVSTLKDMPCGYYAERKNQDDDWIIRKR